MPEYHVEIAWSRDGAAFTDNRYSRRLLAGLGWRRIHAQKGTGRH